MQQFNKIKARQYRINRIVDEIMMSGEPFMDFCRNCDAIEIEEILHNVNMRTLKEHDLAMIRESNRKRCDFYESYY